MIYLGIDPGISGAMAVYDKEHDIFLNVIDLPTCERITGKGNQINWKELYNLLLNTLSNYSLDELNITACIENVGPTPQMGVTSSFNFGFTVGGLNAMMNALGFDIIYVHPTAWKRKMGLIGTDKNKCMEMIRTTYPIASAEYLTLKKHHNRADAMAIAVTGSLITVA